jgi:hypothetical protein
MLQVKWYTIIGIKIYVTSSLVYIGGVLQLKKCIRIIVDNDGLVSYELINNSIIWIHEKQRV